MADTEVLARHRLSVEDYHRIGEAGVLTPDDRVELIDGEIIDMSPIGTRHAGTVNFLLARLSRSIGSHPLSLSVQNPVLLSEHTEVQPDLALIRRRDDYYRTRHPGPEDVRLVVEVADTALTYDRDIKLPLYARAGIPEVWIVDLEGRILNVHRDPHAGGYRDVATTAAPSEQAIIALPGLTVDLSGLFG